MRNLDASLKRYFPLVIMAAIAAIAYFQASGIGEMVASSIGDAPADETETVTAPPLRQESKSAQPILARNPFDSVTGPLDGVTPPPPPPEDDDDEPDDDELEDDDPKCSFGRVVLIMASEDPQWSFASIDGGDGNPALRRVGDDVAGHTVHAMAWDRVWLLKGSERCQIPVQDRERLAAAPKPEPKATTTRRSRTTAQLPDELASKIHKVSDTEFNIERSVVDEILEKQAELMRYTRLRPVKEGDKVVGLRMSRIRGGTLLDVLGLKNGDQISSINGFDLTDPQKALEAYGRLRTADKLTLQVSRGGQPQTIDYNIQ